MEQALRAFPQYQDIENQAAPNGWSTYSGGQITAKKDFSNGLSFLVGYTLEKEMTNLGSIAGGAPGYFSQAPCMMISISASVVLSRKGGLSPDIMDVIL